jgi:hypothetical protein
MAGKGWDGLSTSGKMRDAAAKSAQRAADARKSGNKSAAKGHDRAAKRAINTHNELRRRGR